MIKPSSIIGITGLIAVVGAATWIHPLAAVFFGGCILMAIASGLSEEGY